MVSTYTEVDLARLETSNIDGLHVVSVAAVDVYRCGKAGGEGRCRARAVAETQRTRVTRPTRVAGASSNTRPPPYLDYTCLPFRPRNTLKMASPQLGQLYKELQQSFLSGNLQQTGVLLARLKVRLRSDQPLYVCC